MGVKTANQGIQSAYSGHFKPQWLKWGETTFYVQNIYSNLPMIKDQLSKNYCMQQLLGQSSHWVNFLAYSLNLFSEPLQTTRH